MLINLKGIKLLVLLSWELQKAFYFPSRGQTVQLHKTHVHPSRIYPFKNVSKIRN